MSHRDTADRLTVRVGADQAGLRLDQALARLLPEHSRSRLAAWVKQGKVSLDDTAAEAKRKVWGGEQVRLAAGAPPEETAQRAEDIPLAIVHEDAHLLVVNKPAGLVVHPGSGNWQGTLLNALLHHAPQLSALPRAGIVHRLDKDTSGLLVVARTPEAQTDLMLPYGARITRLRVSAGLYHAVTLDRLTSLDPRTGEPFPDAAVPVPLLADAGKQVKSHDGTIVQDGLQ